MATLFLAYQFTDFSKIIGIHPNDELNIYALDVGQGDSILIISPDGKKLLVDTGPNNKAVNELHKVLGPFDTQLDYVLITHNDMDHIGGLTEIQNNFTIRTLIENATDNNDFHLGCCVLIDFVWPEGQKVASLKDNNSKSAAIFVEYGKFRAFMDGDLPKEYENYLAHKYPLKINLIKISHHGSSTGTDNYMLSVFKPEAAIISVGKGNSYGHPKQSVLDLLKKYNVKIYRTDELGTIHYVAFKN